MLAGALLAQGVLPVVTVTAEANRAGTERVDVAYAELSQGRNSEAIARLIRNRELATDDPAVMINLGAAYVRSGRDQEARKCYERALASREHYDLELADGRWMNSRQAARKANALLRTRQTLALAPRS
jgi:tetratricopeptide (TPR) repeat protein